MNSFKYITLQIMPFAMFELIIFCERIQLIVQNEHNSISVHVEQNIQVSYPKKWMKNKKNCVFFFSSHCVTSHSYGRQTFIMFDAEYQVESVIFIFVRRSFLSLFLLFPSLPIWDSFMLSFSVFLFVFTVLIFPLSPLSRSSSLVIVFSRSQMCGFAPIFWDYVRLWPVHKLRASLLL